MKLNERQEWGAPAYLQLALVVLLLWGSGIASGSGSGAAAPVPQAPPPVTASEPAGSLGVVLGPDGRLRLVWLGEG